MRFVQRIGRGVVGIGYRTEAFLANLQCLTVYYYRSVTVLVCLRKRSCFMDTKGRDLSQHSVRKLTIIKSTSCRFIFIIS